VAPVEAKRRVEVSGRDAASTEDADQLLRRGWQSCDFDDPILSHRVTHLPSKHEHLVAKRLLELLIEVTH
jgi:hypothetical protein